MKKTLAIISCFCMLAVSANAQQSRPVPYVHYFYNSGWLISAADHFIVFDFIPHAASGVTLDDLKKRLYIGHSLGKKIVVMITHEHQDHFDPAIFQLTKDFPDIEFILGWKYPSAPAKNTHTLNAGDSLIMGDYKVYTHAATDDGVGFLFVNKFFSIYHAGDHALWADQILQPFTDELKLIRSKADRIDLAFLPAARGMFTKCAYDSVIEKGLLTSLEILDPGIIGLQHVGCKDKLSVYKTAYKYLSAKIKLKTWIVPYRFSQDFKPKGH